MDIVLRIAAAAAALYVPIVMVAYLLQRQLIYHPTSARPPAPPDLEEVTVTTDDGLDLLAWYMPPTDNGPVLLLLHGNAGDIGDRAYKIRPFAARGHGALLVEYRGYGGNPGKPDEAGLYRDARAGLAFLAERGFAPERIIVYGESLGSGVAVELSQNIPFRALVLEAPFTSLPDTGRRTYPFLPVRLLMRDRYASFDKIDRLAGPLVIIHGERDKTVPVTMGRALLAAAPEPKIGIFIDEAGHNDLYEFGAADKIGAALDQLSGPR